jgi:hypothetical protein
MTDYNLIGQQIGEGLRVLIPLIIGVVVGVRAYNKRKKKKQNENK